MAVPDMDRSATKNETGQISEVVDLVKGYALQETLGPIKGAGRWLAAGAAGAVLIGVATILLMLAVVRLLQTVAVVIEDWPTAGQAWDGTGAEDGWLYGLYEGVPLNEWGGDSIPMRSFQDAADIACMIGGVDPTADVQGFFSAALVTTGVVIVSLSG